MHGRLKIIWYFLETGTYEMKGVLPFHTKQQLLNAFFALTTLTKIAFSVTALSKSENIF